MKFEKADINFYAIIDVDGNEIKNVLCRLYLPTKITDKIELYFQPTKQQAELLVHLRFWKFSLKGEVINLQGDIDKAIVADVVYCPDGIKTSYHAKDFEETYFIGEPSDLQIKHFLNRKSEQPKVTGNFWLTPNQMLQPAFITKHSYTGEVKVEKVRDFDFKLPDETLLKFENNHKRYENEIGDQVSFYELVSRFELDGENNDSPRISEILRGLDDILLLASLASRKKSVCLGMDYYDSKAFIKKYFRNRTIPKDIDQKRNRRELLIDLSDFPDFMRTVFPTFQKYSDIEAFRRTLNFILPSYEETIDSSFVTLYTGLEMIVLHYRKKKEMKNVLSSNKFRKLKKNLKDYIKHLNSLDEDSQEKIIEKLPDLNRISFANAFHSFCDNYSVDLSDLWHVTSKDDGISLSQIRNKLVHGEHFDKKHYTGLMYAREHLRWTIERMILALLGWRIESSNVDSSYLKGNVPYEEWRNELENF